MRHARHLLLLVSLQALQQVEQDLAAEGLGLKVWDATCDPRCNAVDSTLVPRRGQRLPVLR